MLKSDPAKVKSEFRPHDASLTRILQSPCCTRRFNTEARSLGGTITSWCRAFREMTTSPFRRSTISVHRMDPRAFLGTQVRRRTYQPRK